MSIVNQESELIADLDHLHAITRADVVTDHGFLFLAGE
jgi:hypothetical protein